MNQKEAENVVEAVVYLSNEPFGHLSFPGDIGKMNHTGLRNAGMLFLMGVAGNFISLYENGFRCNSQFVDSNTIFYESITPVLDNLKILEEKWVGGEWMRFEMRPWLVHTWEDKREDAVKYVQQLSRLISKERQIFERAEFAQQLLDQISAGRRNLEVSKFSRQLLDQLINEKKWEERNYYNQNRLKEFESLIRLLANSSVEYFARYDSESPTKSQDRIHARYDTGNTAAVWIAPMPTWDSWAWLEEFLPIWNSRNRYRQHTSRAAYYQEHMKIVSYGGYITENGKKVNLHHATAELSKMYRTELHLEPVKEKRNTVIEVWEKDCLDAARQVQEETGEKTAVLNLANRQNPGGGVYTGSGAQEESLFLRSNYYEALYSFASYANDYGLFKTREQYPMDPNFGGVWSGGITVFRGKELEGYPLLDDPWETNFIAVAALNHPSIYTNGNGEDRLTETMVKATRNKIRTILNIAADHQVENLILGAFGCGAFHNPTKHMAELFREVLNEPCYLGRFEKVVFAITGDRNYSTFRDVFSKQ